MNQPIKKRWRVLLISGGITIITLSATAQVSSLLTPLLAKYPYVLHCLSSGGIIIQAIGSGALLIGGMTLGQKSYYYLATACLLSLALSSFTLLGQVFQFGLAGLTVGGSLLILGSIRASLITKRHP